MKRWNKTKGNQLGAATSQDIREAATCLRKVCPLPLPITVKADMDPDGDYWGLCSLINEGRINARFEIRLVRGMAIGMMHMVLVHEWAHALDWRPDTKFRYDHRPTFGVHWGETHCEFLGTN